MRVLLLFAALAPAIYAQIPDAFTGTWKFNATKSKFIDNAEAYSAGTRTYAPAKAGTLVTWDLKSADGKNLKGKYLALCRNGHCIADDVYWKVDNAGAITGETFTNGVVDHTYTRSVSADGKTLTITFFLPGKTEPSSIQVWEKQVAPD